MTTSDKVRARLVEMLRRDLVGPLPPDVAPSDADLQNGGCASRRLPGT